MRSRSLCGSHFQKGLLRRDADTNTPESALPEIFALSAFSASVSDALPRFG